MNIKITDKVERIAKDYTGGRRGEVVEVKENRARVLWMHDRAGDSIRGGKGLKTWVRFSDLKIIQ